MKKKNVWSTDLLDFYILYSTADFFLPASDFLGWSGRQNWPGIGNIVPIIG
jgi:hypothetical protein